MTITYSGAPAYDESHWPGFFYVGGPPPFNRGVRAHKPPAWPHDRPCWCGARRHRKAVPPSARRPLTRLLIWRRHAK